MFRNYKNNVKPLLLPDFTLVTDIKKPKTGFALIYLSDKDDILDFIDNNTLFKPNIFLSYHYPNRDKEDSRTKLLLKRQIEVYSAVKKAHPKIKKMKSEIEDYSNFNLFYDFNPLMDIFNYKLIYNTDKVLSEMFINFLSKRVEEIPYTNKIVYLTLTRELLNDLEDNTRDYYFMLKKFLYFNKKFTFNFDIMIKGKTSNYSIFIPKNFEFNYDLFKGRLELLEKLELKNGQEFTPEEISVLKTDSSDKDNSENISTEMTKQQIKNEIMKKVAKDTINRLDGKEAEIEASVTELVDKEPDIENNDILKAYLLSLQEKEMEKKNDILKERRVKTLNEKYAKVKFRDKSIDEILKTKPANIIEKKNVKVEHSNDVLHKAMTLSEFEKQYNEVQKDKDIISVITAFTNDPDIKLIPTEIKVEDSSTSLDKKETFRITFQDDAGNNHNFVIDVPVMLDDRYLYLNGTKKNLNKQLIFKPIVKTGPDEVQIVTLSNKTFIYRIGTKYSVAIENIVQLLTNNKIKYSYDKLDKDNEEFRQSCEFKELCEVVSKIEHKDLLVNMNIKDITEEINKRFKISLIDEIDFNEETPYLIYGNSFSTVSTKDGSIIHSYLVNGKKLTKTTGTNGITMDIISRVESSTPGAIDGLSLKIGSNYMYASMTSMGTKIPVVLPLIQRIGLLGLLDKLNIDYEILDKRKRLNNLEKLTMNTIELANCTVYYKNSNHDLLLNGLKKIDLSTYTLDDLDRETPYIFLYEEFGSKHLVKGMPGYLDILLDPISRDILVDMGYEPTIKSEDLLIIASDLLNQNFYRRLNDMENYRIRSNEIIYAALMYDTLSTAFKKYKEAKKQGNKTVKVTVPQDTLIKKVTQITEDYSELNP